MRNKPRIIVEVEPTRRLEKLLWQAQLLLEARVWRAAVPDAPLGIPKASALFLAAIFEHYGLQAIAHFRLRDLNRLAFEQLVWGACLAGVRRILFLRGDEPRNAIDVNEVSTEEAIKYVKNNKRLASCLEVGVYLSFRKPRDAILSRVAETRADFYVVNRFEPQNDTHAKLLDVLKRDFNIRVYAYLILAPRDRLEGLKSRLEGQIIRPLDELDKWLEAYNNAGVDAVILSAPGAFTELMSLLKEI